MMKRALMLDRLLVSLTVFLIALGGGAASAQGKPILDVQGPLSQSPASHAFGGAAWTQAPEDLQAKGYAEEEFVVSGAANVYEWPARGELTIRTPDAPYTTRVLVRRPATARTFSGRIVVELLNPSNLFDLNIGWALQHEEIVRRGDAWVGISAKPVAIAALKTFDPSRYGALSWKNPLSLEDARNCSVTGDTAQATENGLVWDIHTDVAEWLRSEAMSNPFRYGGKTSRAKRLYAWGYSQTGSYLFTYINAVHPDVVARTGKAPFDGYLVAVSSGPAPINQCAERIAAGDPRRPIRDVGVPVIHVMSQSDYIGWAPYRREDGNRFPDLYRDYDLAGAGHATPDELRYAAKGEDIEKSGRTIPAMSCDQGPRSRFPSWAAFNAIYRNLTAWVETGKAPPPSQTIRISDGKPVLDEHGNVTGGLRSALVDVPAATWAGNSTGLSFCRIAGHELPFAQDKISRLYPTERTYRAMFSKSIDQLVRARSLTREDGATLKARSSEYLSASSQSLSK